MKTDIDITKKYKRFKKEEFNLDNTLEKIVTEFKNFSYVKEIWLFGSYAYGKPNEKSDLDICVVVDQYNYKIGRLSVILGRILKSKNCDLIFITEKDKQKNIKNYTTVFYDIFKKGKNIYKAKDNEV